MTQRRREGRSVVTISDVARAAGVATSTVSRALSQPERVSKMMLQRVQAVASELGYHPNVNARSLKSGRTLSMALLIPGVTNPYFFDLIRGTQTEAKLWGYRHMLIDTEASVELEERALRELPGSVDGVVLTGSRQSDERVRAVAERLPLVVVNREIEDVPSVVVDTAPAAAQAMEYLVSLGHRRIAYLSGPHDSWSNRKRWEALSETSARLGIECLRLGSFAEMSSGAAAADAAIHNEVTAAMFFNDMLAIAALKRFAERGVSVPEDMSIIGCDGIFGSDFCNPPLTTLTAPIDEVARIATDMLLSRLSGPAGRTRHARVPAHLTVRGSATTARRR